MQTKEHSSKCKTHCSAFLHCLQFFFSLFLGWVGKSDMWQKPTRKLADNCRRVIPLNTESFIMDIVLISSPGERRDIYHDENITLLTLVSAWHDPRHSKPYFIRLLSALDLSGGIPRFPGEAVRWLWQHVLSWEVLQLEALHWRYVRHERERERERERGRESSASSTYSLLVVREPAGHLLCFTSPLPSSPRLGFLFFLFIR